MDNQSILLDILSELRSIHTELRSLRIVQNERAQIDIAWNTGLQEALGGAEAPARQSDTSAELSERGGASTALTEASADPPPAEVAAPKLDKDGQPEWYIDDPATQRIYIRLCDGTSRPATVSERAAIMERKRRPSRRRT